MRSYFFVPGTKLKNLALIQSKGVDEIIIDLEDAVRVSERESILSSLLSATNKEQYWIRVPVRSSFQEMVNRNLLQVLISGGFNKIVLPKLRSASEFNTLLGNLNLEGNVQIVLLVEHPHILLDLGKLFHDHSDIIKSVGLGSHDLMSFMGGKHTLKNLEYPRQKVLYEAKAIGIETIDIASMELKDQAVYTREVLDGFDKGYDAKFLIHPWQQDIFNSISYYSAEEIKWAESVMQAYTEAGSNAEFSPIVINGKVIERLHIDKAKSIIENAKRNADK